MTTPIPPRIAEVLADGYLADLGARTTDQVRAMRDLCSEVAAELSYTRRVLQGQLDVARAEASRRATGDQRPLIAALGEVLADHPPDPAAPAPGPMAAVVGEPAEMGAVLDVLPLGTLPDMDDDALSGAIADVEVREAAVSRWRRGVLDVLDVLQADLVARYRDGGASIDEIVLT